MSSVSTVPSAARLSKSVSSPDDADRAARDRGRGRREVRHEQADILIDRAVVKPQADLGVALRIEGDPPGAGHRQPRRRRVDLAAQVRAPQRELAGDLADGFARPPPDR